jgi:hypothetical protein
MARGGACGVTGQSATGAMFQEEAEEAKYLALRHGGFQRARNTESGHFRGYGDFEGKLFLRSEGLAAGGVLLQGPVFEDPAGQLRVNGFFDPLIEQRGNLPAQVRSVIQPR